MSEQANIGNSVYTFNFSIATGTSRPTDGRGTSITKGDITHLTIVDDLTPNGYSGFVKFKNPANILSHIGTGGSQNKNSMWFNIDIKCDDFKGKNTDDTTIKATVQLRDSSDQAKGIDGDASFTFSELQVSQLTQNNVGPAHASLQKSKTIGEALINTLTYGGGNGTLKGGSVKTQGTPTLVPGIITNGDTYYDVAVKKLYSLLYYAEHGPGLVRVENKSSGRVVDITPIGEFTKNFIKAFDSKQSLAKYVTDSFTLAPHEPNNSQTFRESVIEKYDVIKPKYEMLLKDRWVNYSIAQQAAGDITTSKNNTFTYANLKSEFEKVVCGGKQSNLPERSDLGNKDVKFKSFQGQFTVNDENLNEAALKCFLFKSFIYDNTKIKFRVPGLPHRKAGYFIAINDVNKRGGATEHAGFWYVVSVLHVFENETYVNEIEAVRFFTLR
jgi:hypothetical protein